ncbi:hypothetical protein BGW41_004099 [Actinomortierella wolfii]|nr:hypothetical protein BGW41_004099 [Actinomortierella wolfii]
MKSFLSATLAFLGALSIATTSVEAQLITTPGLVVSTPYQGMGVYQGSYMSISFRFLSGMPVGGSTVTMAKKDGSGNTTLYTVPDTQSLTQFLESYSVPESTEAGDYRVSIITKPGTGTPKPPNALPPPPSSNNTRLTTAVGAVAAPTATSAGGTPAPTGAPNAPSVYYHAVDIRVLPAKDKPKGQESSALTLSQSAGQIAWKAAVALGMVAAAAFNL